MYIYIYTYIYIMFFPFSPRPFRNGKTVSRTDMVSCATVASADFGERPARPWSSKGQRSSTTDSGASGPFQDTTRGLFSWWFRTSHSCFTTSKLTYCWWLQKSGFKIPLVGGDYPPKLANPRAGRSPMFWWLISGMVLSWLVRTTPNIPNHLLIWLGSVSKENWPSFARLLIT